MDAEIGYGVPSPLAASHGHLAPYFGISTGDGPDVYRAGARWSLAPGALVSLGSTRQRAERDADEDHSVMLRGSFVW